jgi:hypothetical protein
MHVIADQELDKLAQRAKFNLDEEARKTVPLPSETAPTILSEPLLILVSAGSCPLG